MREQCSATQQSAPAIAINSSSLLDAGDKDKLQVTNE